MRIHKIDVVSRTYRNITRYRQILTVLFKYGFESLIDRLHLGQYLDIGIRMISHKWQIIAEEGEISLLRLSL